MNSDWSIHKLSEIAKLSIGRTPSRKNPSFWTKDLEHPFCSIADMGSKIVDPQREGVTQGAIDAGKAKLARAGTLLMSFKLTLGKVGFAARDIYPNEAIVMIEPDDSIVLKEYLYAYFSVTDISAGSGQAMKGKTLNKKSLALIPVLVPPIDEQKRIVDLTESIDQATEAYQNQLIALNDLRNSLLSEILAQKTRIPKNYFEMVRGHD